MANFFITNGSAIATIRTVDKNIIIQHFIISITTSLISGYFIYLIKVVEFLIKFQSNYPNIISGILGVIIGLIYWLYYYGNKRAACKSR